MQLEQRVALIEESDSESEPLCIKPNRMHIEPLNFLINDFGSKETESTAPLISLNKKEDCFINYLTEDFIKTIDEEFINQEIEFITQYLMNDSKISIENKDAILKLNFPLISIESSTNSIDKVKILSGSINKSEYPIGYSLI